MSTKIYNAYQITIQTTQEIQTFIHTLQTFCKKEIQKRIDLMLTNKVQKIIDDIVLYTKHPDLSALIYSDFQSHIQFLNYQAHTCAQQLLHQFKSANVTQKKSNTFTECLEQYYPIQSCKLTLSNTIEIQSILNANSPYNIKQEIALFYQDPTHICIIAYGDILTYILNESIHNNNIPELEKFNIKDFHYQNQTDKPESISDQEWTLREKEWNRILPSGYPKKDGLIIPVIQPEDIDTYLFSISSKTLLKQPSFQKNHRAKILAEELIECYVISQTPEEQKKNVSDLININRTIKQDLKTPKSETYTKYQEFLNICKQILPEITKDILYMNLKTIIESV